MKKVITATLLLSAACGAFAADKPLKSIGVSVGDLAPGQGAQLLAAIGALARVAEIDELTERIERLEGHHAKT